MYPQFLYEPIADPLGTADMDLMETNMSGRGFHHLRPSTSQRKS